MTDRRINITKQAAHCLRRTSYMIHKCKGTEGIQELDVIEITCTEGPSRIDGSKVVVVAAQLSNTTSDGMEYIMVTIEVARALVKSGKLKEFSCEVEID